MPQRFLCLARETVGWADYEESPLKPGQIRVRCRHGVEKHGTMMAFYKGYANDRGRWDADALMHRPGEGALWNYPIPLGNMQVGEVVELGEGVESFRLGDEAFASAGFQPTVAIDAAEAWRLCRKGSPGRMR